MTEEFKGNLDHLEGEPFYVVDNKIPIVMQYIVKRTHSATESQRGTILYEVLPDTNHSYTVGSRSGQLESKFQIQDVKAVQTLFHSFQDLAITDIADAKTRKFVIDVIEDNPEYFI